MAALNFGIVYATGSKMLRRICVPDDDFDLTQIKLHAGESLLLTPAGPHDVATCTRLVEEATGVAPLDPWCAVVNQGGTVMGFLNADPALDQAPEGMTLASAYSRDICTGCTYDPATGLFTAPAVPAFTDRRGNPVAARDARVIARA